MLSLPIKVQVPCQGGFHDVVVSGRGRISFPCHPQGRRELQRMLDFEELGGESKGGCHKVWMAWTGATDSLPDKLASYRRDRGNHRVAERAARRLLSRARRRHWGAEIITQAAIDALPPGREAFRVAALALLRQELARRGHRATLTACLPSGHGTGQICLAVNADPAIRVEAGWYPPGSVALTINVAGREVINLVRGKNDRKALSWAADAVAVEIARQHQERSRVTSHTADGRREALLRRVARLNKDFGRDFFQAVPTAAVDGVAIRGAVPPPLTDAAARLALKWLDGLAVRLQRLRELSALRAACPPAQLDDFDEY